MFCGSCGYRLPDGARFCANCGSPVVTTVVEETLNKAVEESKEEVSTQLEESKEEVSAQLEESKEEVSTQLEESKEDVKTQLEDSGKEIEKKLNDSFLEGSRAKLELDESVLAVLETPEIPECEIDFEKEEAAITDESKEEEPAEEPVTEAPAQEEEVVEESVTETPVQETVEESVTETPAQEAVEESVSEAPAQEAVEESVSETPAQEAVEESVSETPAQEEEVVEEPVSEAPAQETVEQNPSQEVAAEAPTAQASEKEVSPAPAPTPFVIPSVSVENNTEEHAKSVKKEKPVKEAFKFLSFLGIIVALVGCFLDIHKFNNWNEELGDYELRVDKLFEFEHGMVMIVALAVALLLVIIRKSSFALSGIMTAITAYGLYACEFYYRGWERINSQGVDFTLGIGSFLVWGGLLLSFMGIFMKVGKKPLFKI